jgi:hypothetical protein
MNRRQTRILLWMSLALVAVGLLACGGICSGLISHYVLFHVYTYEATEQPSLNGATIAVLVTPQTRIHEPPDRLLGPPYAFMLTVRNPPGQATAAILHSVRVCREDGSQLVGRISIPRHEVTSHPEGHFILLFGQFDVGEWGRRPTLIADIEIEYASAAENTRGEVRIPLRPKHTQELYIP